MKRLLALLLSTVMTGSLIGCGGGEEPIQKSAEEKPSFLQLYQAEDTLGQWELYQAEWEELYLSEEDAKEYPALAQALDEMNGAQKAYHKEWVEWASVNAAAEKEMEYFYEFTSTSAYYVQRSDSRLLSIREDFYEYSGGVHGMYGTIGHTFDPSTGEAVELQQILRDTEKIPEILSQKLEEKYPEDIYYDMTELLAEYAMEEFVWTMDYQGLTFYFAPYELASYAAGQLTAVIWFEEYPELFYEWHTEQPEHGYIKAIPLGTEVDLMLGDDSEDMICVAGAPVGEYGEQRVNIRRNEEGYSDPDSFGYWFRPYLLCQEDRFYVLVEGSADNDYRTLYIYDLNTPEIEVSSVLWGTGSHHLWQEQHGRREVLLDPAEICLDTAVYMLGTMDGTRTYRFEEGALVPKQEYYELPETMSPLCSKLPIEVYLPEEDVTEEVPAGTEFYFLRTDNETYIEMRLEDGRVCRLEIGSDGWDRTVNGISEYDLFEEILYAG